MIRRIAALLLSALVCAAAAAQTTTITASHIEQDISGTPLPAGYIVLTPVNSMRQPTGFSYTGGQVLPRASYWPITNGSITGVTVPDTSDTSPSGIGYQVTITDSNKLPIYSYAQPIYPTGATWSFDSWSPTMTVQASPPTAVSSGSQAPVGKCTPPSLYYYGTAIYMCVTSSWSLMTGAGTNATSLQGVAVSATAPTDGQALMYSASNASYAPASVTGGASTIYLSATGDIGAQINAAAAKLGQAGGTIVLPTTSAGTWSTTATIPWRSISLVGSGPLASIFDCTVAGDCLVIHPDIYSPTNGLPAGGTVSGFSIVGNGAANQVDVHGEDLEGWVLHDIVLDGASAAGDVCLKLEDLNYWTERNHTYNFQFGYGCSTSVELYTNPSDPNSYGSFGYNDFEFAMQPGTNQVGLSMVGTMELYNGSLTIVANAQGTGPSVVSVSGAATATGERLNMDVEGMPGISNGNIFDVTSTDANLQFVGAINDHPGNPIGNSTIAAGSQVMVAAAQSMNNSVAPVIATNAASGFTYAFGGFVGCPNEPAGAPCIEEVGQSTSNNSAAMFYFQSAGNGVPNPIGGAGINGNNASLYFNGGGDVWGARSLGIASPTALTAGPDTAFSRISPAVMALGNGTSGNASGWLELAAIGNASSSNTDLRGHLTLASGTATYTFAETYTVAPTCTASDTTAIEPTQVTTTTKTLTVNGTGTDVVNYVCAD